MRRIFLVLCWSLLPVAAATATDRLLDVPRLKSSAVVVADVVRIGDLIENAGAVADVAIFRSPDVGSTGSVSTAKVLEAARQHNLLIVDSRGVNDVEITRDSRPVSPRDLEVRIARAFAGQQGLGDADKLSVSFDRTPRTFYVEPVAGDFQVARSGYDPRTGRFDVTLILPGSSIARGYNLRFTGTIVETLEVPVLTRSFNRSEVIRPVDVTLERRPRSEVSAETIVDLDGLVGLAARQGLRAGAPVRRSDVVRPEIVKRDEAVTMHYEVPGITLTLRGKAMEGGAKGDTINVVNPQSKRVLQAVIVAPGKVVIDAVNPPVIINTASTNSKNSQSE